MNIIEIITPIENKHSMNIGPMHGMGACRPGLFRMGRIRSHKSEYGSHVSQQITSIYVRISILLLGRA